MKKLVIKDIARLAGVSLSTVSKAINDYDTIPLATKEKIRGIIKKMGYSPLKSAKALRSGRNDAIAFMSGRISAHFTAEILNAIEKKTFSAGRYKHAVIPFSTDYDEEIALEIFNKILYGGEAAALVALAVNPQPDMLLKYKNAGIPVILMENNMENAHSVNIDNRKGGFMAAEYLVKSGRKRIGLICGGLRAGSRCGYSYVAAERKAGFEEALKRYGIKNDKRYLELAKDYTIKEGEELFGNFINKGAKPDAVFCASSDMTAIGVMESAKKRGLKIPHDLAVIGFDDSPTSAFLNPPLSSVRQPIDSLGEAIFETAVNAIDGKLDKESHIVIEPELIIRQSAKT